ncbi:uncharacterized protein LOC118501101 isoform X2 [Phyllostomus discolor]|uniref:Uncharacterized protein LOC118501101 isoform X2 n=1 Tax=Phyllostomus discolor TaxID=89673 RepID=A0A7E6DXM4_9CHIR|nr:uncharacterized protein LOC118501101 isoform X2 [Phyllostomus discolor]
MSRTPPGWCKLIQLQIQSSILPCIQDHFFPHEKSYRHTNFSSNQCRFHCKEIAEWLRWRWLWLRWNQKRGPGVSQWPAGGGGAHLISAEVGEGELEARKRSAEARWWGMWVNEEAGSRDGR